MSTLDLNPEKLIIDLKAGKIEPYNTIFDEMYRPLCNYIYHMSDGANDGEDIAQDALIKFYDKRTDFPSVMAIKGYLYTLCRNAYFNWSKHEKVKERHRLSLKDEPDTNEPAYVEAEALRIIHAEMEKLPAECKKVFTLLFKGHSNQEVMAMLDMSASLVSKHKKYALDKLKIGLANKRLVIIALLAAIYWLKFFLGSFSIFGGLLVYYYTITLNQIH